MSAVIIHPTQGQHVVSFQATAYHAARKVYGGAAIVYGTKYQPGEKVKFDVDTYATPKGKRSAGFWEEVQACDTFVYVGHLGYIDGPILAYHDAVLYSDDGGKFTQPWATTRSDPPGDVDRFFLDTPGTLFWAHVGNGHLPSMKIILIGCNSGETYAGAVARAAGCTVFGYVGSCPAGNAGSILPVLTDIENGGNGGLKEWR